MHFRSAINKDEVEPAHKIMKIKTTEVISSTSKPESRTEFNRFCDSDQQNNNDDFILTEDGYVVVYTDGACSNNGKYGAKGGIGVWFNSNHIL